MAETPFINYSPIFNPNEFLYQTESLSLADADLRYLKLSGGTINGSLTIAGSCNVGSLLVNGSLLDLSVITGIVAGTASASKALVVDSSKNISGINTFSATSITATTLTGTLQTGIQSNISQVGTLSFLNVSGIISGGSSLSITSGITCSSLTATTINATTSLVLGSSTVSSSDIAKLTGITNGTAAASKALVLDSSRNITNINSLSASTITLSGDIGCSNINVSGNVGTAGLNVSASAVVGGEIDCSNLVINSTTMSTENKLLIGVSSDSTSSRRIVCLDNTISSTGTAAMILGYNTATAGAAVFTYARTSGTAGYGTMGLFGSSNTIQWNSSGRVYIGASSAGVSIAERLVVAGAMQADFYYDRQSGGEPRPVFAIRNPQATDVSAGYAYVGMGSHNDTTRGLRFQRIDTTFNYDTTAGSGYATLYPAGVSNQSDYRIKTDIEEIPYGLEEVLQLNPIRYKLKYEPDDYGKRIGFLAHEVQKYIPELVEGEKDDTYANGCIKTQSMDYACMVSVLVKAIQELNKKISELEYKLNAS